MEQQNHIESMQNTIKTLQQRSQHIEKLLEKGSDTLIFQIGSDSIKYGLANKPYPQKIKTILAYKIKDNSPKDDSFHQYHPFSDEFEKFDQVVAHVENQLKRRGNIKQEPKNQKSKQKQRLEQDVKRNFELTVSQDKLDEGMRTARKK